MPRKYLRRMETISNAGSGHHSDLERIRRRSQESQQLQQENLHQNLLYSPAEMCRRRHSANVKRRRSSAASSSSNSRRSSSTTLLIGPSKREKSENARTLSIICSPYSETLPVVNFSIVDFSSVKLLIVDHF
uniref:Uncharacterized protein n=1 Tax=Meloidogyne incognita TaxID=6306 RepID=A0A914M1Q8_MELIC